MARLRFRRKAKKPKMKSTVPTQSVFGNKRGWKLFNMISIIAAVVILWAVVVGNEGFSGFINHWRELDWRWMAATAACMGAYYLLEGWELHLLTQRLYYGLSFRSSMRTAMIGQLYSALTPFSSGGQAVQLLYMQKDGLDTGGAGSVLTVKSAIYQIGIVVFAVVAILCSFSFFEGLVPGFRMLSILGMIINAIVTGSMLMLLFSTRVTSSITKWVVKLLAKLRIIKDPEQMLERANAQFEIFHQSAAHFGRKWDVLVQVMLLTLCQLCVLYLVPHMLYRTFGLRGESPILMIFAVSMVSMIASFVPLPGGSGGAEGMFVLLFAPIFPADKLLIALLLWRIFTYYLGILLGAMVVSSSRRRQRAVIRLPLDDRHDER